MDHESFVFSIHCAFMNWGFHVMHVKDWSYAGDLGHLWNNINKADDFIVRFLENWFQMYDCLIYLSPNLREGLEQVDLMVQIMYFSMILLWPWWYSLEKIICISYDVALSLCFVWFVWCKGWGRSLLFQSLILHWEVHLLIILSYYGAWTLFYLLSVDS